jgi:hypothetical protein
MAVHLSLVKTIQTVDAKLYRSHEKLQGDARVLWSIVGPYGVADQPFRESSLGIGRPLTNSKCEANPRAASMSARLFMLTAVYGVGE